MWPQPHNPVPNAHVQLAWSAGLTGKTLGLDPAEETHEWPMYQTASGKRLLLRDMYEGKTVLGQGSFGVAVSALFLPTRTPAVLKLVRRAGEGVDAASDRAYTQTFVTGDRLFTLLLGLRPHVNVVRYVDALECTGWHCIVMEPLDGPELFDYMEEADDAAEPATIQRMAKQMLRALAYVHQHGLIHRDVKIDAFRFRTPDAPSAPLVLFDFGLCCAVNSQAPRAKCGTLEYMAPEMDLRNYDQKVDVWSAGICLFMMLSACMPFDRDAPSRPVGQLVTRGEMANAYRAPSLEAMPPAAVACMKQLLQFDPERRPDSADAFALVSDDANWGYPAGAAPATSEPQRKPKGMYSSVLQLHKSYAQDEAAVAEFVNEVKSSEGRTPEQACCTAPAPSSCSVS